MAKKIDCICNLLEAINGFYSIAEFERFQRYIDRLLKDGDLIEIPVQEKFAGFDEQWYKCAACEQIWRLIHPDFPFKGIWDTVK